MPPPANQAAWLVAKRARPLEVKPAPYTHPGPSEIVVKNGAVAINPVDWAKQQLGDLLLGYLKYPFVLGGDLAGEVVEIGTAVTRFKVGDRVLGHAVGFAAFSNKPAEGAFQLYTIVREHLAAVIPGYMSYEQACVIPLTLSTAACGLFHKDFLALDPPSVPPPPPHPRALVITGGASSLGSNAIQLAVSAGYEVYTTASPHNFDFVTRQLGASGVFDYNSKNYVAKMIEAINASGKILAGALAIGNGSTEACTEVLRSCNNCSRKFVAQAGPPWPDKFPETRLKTATLVGSMVWRAGSTTLKGAVRGVRAKFIDNRDLSEPSSEINRLIYSDFIAQALAVEQFIPAPEALIVGKGLERIQDALDIQAKGVSGKKVVVVL